MFRAAVSLAVLLLCSDACADAAAELRDAVQRDYSYRDLGKIDWRAAFDEFLPRLRAAASADAFADIASELLVRAHDVHITLQVGARTIQPYQRRVESNLSLPLISNIVGDVTSDHRCVSWGHARGGVGYIIIGAWTAGCSSSAEAALDALSSAPAVIIDVRPNNGGNDALAAEFAGRFTDRVVLFGYVDRLVNGHFEARQPRFLQPASSRKHYRGKLIVLMGPICMSSNESFLLMMRAVGARLVGGASYGSSGNPLPHRLSNGVVVNLPSWREYRLDGQLIESNGISPDVHVDWPASPAADVVLLRALKIVSPE